MNDLPIPARVVSPGRIVQRELEVRGWTQMDLAQILHCPTENINQIITGSKQLSAETATELAHAFGTSPEFWTNLEANYRFYSAQVEAEDKG